MILHKITFSRLKRIPAGEAGIPGGVVADRMVGVVDVYEDGHLIGSLIRKSWLSYWQGDKWLSHLALCRAGRFSGIDRQPRLYDLKRITRKALNPPWAHTESWNRLRGEFLELWWY